jgi:formylglycine-generating enzyme required for sulfatase activity
MLSQKLFYFFPALILFTGAHVLQKTSILFDVKTTDKNLAKVTDSLYAYKFETSNAEYNFFLQSIRTENSHLYEKCLVDSTNWPLRYGEPLKVLYHRHPAYANHPVVNINYEGAVEYCKWLTGKYNTASKRKFNKVEFVLPEEQEWIMAAQAGHKGRKWSMTGDAMVNKKGVDLYNFKKVGDSFMARDSAGQPVVVNYSEEKSAMFNGINKKFFYTIPVKSIYPNDFGLYNTCGNVAEMIVIKDYAMGGSWNS